jgi:hypothetical protein
MATTKKAVKPATKKQINETAVINEVSKAAAKTTLKKAVVKAVAKLEAAAKVPKKAIKVEVTKAPTRTAKDLARKPVKVKLTVSKPQAEIVASQAISKTPVTVVVKRELQSENGRISFSELMRRAHQNSNPPF